MIEKGHIGLARVDRDLRVVERRGVLSNWLSDVGEPCCDCPLLFGMEDDLRRLIEKPAENITLPGVHMDELGEGKRVNVCVSWEPDQGCFLVLTQLDYGAGEIEALLATERRNKQILDEKLREETERANIQTRINAVAQERARIARDLHDTLIQSMVGVLTQIRLARKLIGADPALAAQELGGTENLARKGLENARAVLGQIRERVLQDVTLGAKIRSALADLKASLNIRVALEMDPDADDLRGELAYGVARVFEEALRNVERHARARTLDIALRLHDEDGGRFVRLTIRDNGVGFDPSLKRIGHYGLVGMIEQVELLGGALAIESASGAGTSLVTRIPIPRV